MPTAFPNTKAMRVVTVAVCVAAGLVSAWLGSAASFIYSYDAHHRPAIPGIVLGLVGGVLAGLVWSKRMRHQTFRQTDRRHRPSGSLVGWGTLWGVVAGVMATAILHLGLTLVRGQWAGRVLLACAIVAVLTGAVFGLVIGVIWWTVALKLSLQEQRLPPQEQP